MVQPIYADFKYCLLRFAGPVLHIAHGDSMETRGDITMEIVAMSSSNADKTAIAS